MLFPDLGGLVLELPSVGIEECPVIEAREEALARLRSNLPGPHRSALFSPHTVTLSHSHLQTGMWLACMRDTRACWMGRLEGKWRHSYTLMLSCRHLQRYKYTYMYSSFI